MFQLQDITISDDKTSALFQGGVWDGQVIDELWDQGYVTGNVGLNSSLETMPY